MNENDEKVERLLQQLEILLQKQQQFNQEISILKNEILQLRQSAKPELMPPPPETPVPAPRPELVDIVQKHRGPTPVRFFPPKKKGTSNIEKFIGENLISKIGIAITIIGVGIGAKYSIDHELISPLTRVVLGFLVGIGLLVFGFRLKSKYEAFSAVLVSGAMAILFFMTYIAYSLYALLPQSVSFAMMVSFTAFTVYAAILYARQVIALIGMVGAYAVPFLLSDGSGNITILFSYMTILNIGILIISFKQYWKPLYYSSFGITWLVFMSWYFSKYQETQHFSIAITFLFIFFLVFYLTFLAYKLVKKEVYGTMDIILLLANSFIFYSLGYLLLDNSDGPGITGLFTLANAVVHLLISILIYKQKAYDKNLLYLVSGLVLVFITISIPVQLDGNWVSLLWAGEAALLFWIGRKRSIGIYERLSFPLMLLAMMSIAQDWLIYYDYFDPSLPATRIEPIFNVQFLSSLLFTGFFLFINIIHSKTKPVPDPKTSLGNLFSYMIPVFFLLSAYFSFETEISNYWEQLYRQSAISNSSGKKMRDLFSFKVIWILNYTMVFLSSLTFLNARWLKMDKFGPLNLFLNYLAMAYFLLVGLMHLDHEHLTGWIRYLSIANFALLLWIAREIINIKMISGIPAKSFMFFMHLCILWIASSELINVLEWMSVKETNRIGLSILWGLYALFLIILGIWKKNEQLRIAAIVLFSVTLVKLFFYDLSALTTIAKTIVFVVLGILLLIISFLYNKYRNIISGEAKV
jgi:uncharacterized membrane protein